MGEEVLVPVQMTVSVNTTSSTMKLEAHPLKERLPLREGDGNRASRASRSTASSKQMAEKVTPGAPCLGQSLSSSSSRASLRSGRLVSTEFERCFGSTILSGSKGSQTARTEGRPSLFAATVPLDLDEYGRNLSTSPRDRRGELIRRRGALTSEYAL